MPGSEAVRRTTLRSQIADALRDEVIAGRLPAGRQFTVKEIAEQYGVSATPVREALLDLCSQGLLDVELHKSYRVRAFSYADFRDMVEARALIVEGIFRLPRSLKGAPGTRLAEHTLDAVPPAALASVRRRAEEAARAAVAGDLDILIGYDLRFWRELAGLVGNPYISDFLDRVRVQSWIFTVPLLRRLPTLRGRLWHGHGELVEAVATRDAIAAERIIAAYNEHSLALIASVTE
ncbi:GntR family transcriptional regulator [Streptomyces eurocidicus]|uniref:GntR family transcriptional regulator n=1 Tax=Streptomyces eurocidicus TaxID=66423 RepID=A0A2N8NYL2_STREU|nr:GntR family transcriptional regulator [Streptomyces eurocidicus]MBB5121427.1 DNA-binding GntR family transcriptional regulator [Streptomyces eurocidicus]MBF6051030.1 GntR family transcriptional regulator [Streptomyces eurocidicus]PNE33861.1 GntR family transcriptional regulator [Streptomyces eurocidicus]